jgi:GWxTD domain-containing protein
MSRLILLPAAAVLMALALPLAGHAQESGGELPQCSHLPPYFCADAAYFMSDDDAVVVEVYFSVCNAGLQFVKSGDGYRASGDISAVLLDGKDDQVAGDTYRIRLFSGDYGGTNSIDSCTSRMMAFRARPGDFKLVFGLYDRDSRIKSVVEATLKVPDLSGFPSLSDIRFLEKGGDPTEGRGALVSNVRRIYTEQTDSIPYYFEVYCGEAGDSLELVRKVSGRDGEKVLETSDRSAGSGTVARLEGLRADTLANGRYTLELEVRRGGEVLASRAKDFEIRRQSFHLDRDMEEAVAILTYIASGGEVDRFEKASEEERKRIWEEFWREKDPTPGTPRNELLEEHLQRFRYANDHFGVGLTQGWRTDRGRIYIIYGQPDEVESHPFEIGTKPTEVWYYYTKGRRFVFIDETGFGDYVLVGGGG